jgi:hypothetical protein
MVTDRCLFGVDINPMAVEMAKLSLWLITLQPDRPFTFLDHALKCGDSLLGICRFKQLETFSLDDTKSKQVLIVSNYDELIRTAIAIRRELEALPSNNAEQIAAKEDLNDEAEERLSRLKLSSDLLIAAELIEGSDAQKEMARAGAHLKVSAYIGKPIEEFRQFVRKQLNGRRPFHWPLEFPEMFERGGFNCFVGNPPFLGGTRISTANGRDYLAVLKALNPDAGDRTDLVAYFFRRAFSIVCQDGTLGLIGTNTIAETDTSKAGLRSVTREGGTIFRAERERIWPGSAGLCVSVVHIQRGSWSGARILDGEPAQNISFVLTAGFDTEDAKELRQPFPAGNGAKPNSEGFLISQAEAEDLTRQDPHSSTVLVPYLAGDDIVSRPDAQPERWTVYFGDIPLRDAEAFRLPMQIVRARVQPERAVARDRVKREKWWQYERHAKDVLSAARACRFCFAAPYTSKYLVLTRVRRGVLISDGCIAFATDDWGYFAMLQSTVHEIWARRPGMSRLETRPRYNPSLCFRTFPFLPDVNPLRNIGETYHEFRHELVSTRGEGLTTAYNHFHNSTENSADIVQLRGLHTAMDRAVVVAYGWNDLDLGHGFHETKQGVRYTISEPARRTVLDRLLKLNHERYAEEVKAGLHDKRNPKPGSSSRRRLKPEDSGSDADDSLFE